MITATLHDSSDDFQLPILNVPLSEDEVDSSVDVVTLDNNIYTDFTAQKRQWKFPFEVMKKADYDRVRGFYDRQFTLFQYPTLDIPFYSVSGVYVRMYLNTKEVWNNCGDVQGLEITLRETDPLPIWSS